MLQRTDGQDQCDAMMLDVAGKVSRDKYLSSTGSVTRGAQAQHSTLNSTIQNATKFSLRSLKPFKLESNLDNAIVHYQNFY